MKFNTRKDLLFTIVILGVNTFLIGLCYISLFTKELGNSNYWLLTIIVPLIIFLFWIFYGTYYQLTEKELSYYSGPFRGKIPLENITEVIVGKTLWVGTKPATARKGLIIKYNKYDELYISPNSNESFMKALLAMKGDITSTYKQNNLKEPRTSKA